MSWLAGIQEWMAENARSMGVPLDPAAELAIQQQTARDNAAALEGLRLSQQQPAATSGYDGVQPAAKPGLGTDPAHLAFLRAMGLEDQADATNNQVAIDALNRRAGLQLQDLGAQGADQRQSIADSHEARGLFRSGARLRDQSKQQEGEARQASGIVAGQTDQTAQLVAELAQRRAARQRQSAEQAFSTAGGVVAGSGY